MKFFENKKILYRFESGGKHGFGHLNRSLEFIKFLSKKNFKVTICASRETKKYIKIQNLFFFYKDKNSSENDFLRKVNGIYKNNIIIIDFKYNYSLSSIKNLAKNNSIIFVQNFSKGVGYADKLIIPDSHSYKRIINRNFAKSKIYFGSKYLILRDEILNLKKIKSKKYLSINFGGTDPNNIGEIVLEMLIKSNWNKKTYFMLGDGQKHNDLKNKYKIPKNIIFCKFNIKRLMNSELTITAFGVTTYELAYHGVKNLIILNDDKKKFKLNNKFINVKNLGFYKKLNYNNFCKNINFYWDKKNKLKNKKLSLDKKAKNRFFNLLKN